MDNSPETVPGDVTTGSHRRLLAGVWAAMMAIWVLLGAFIAVFFGGMGALATRVPDSNTGEPAPEWFGWLFGGMGLFVGGIFAVLGSVGAAGAWGYWHHRRWAAFVLGGLALLHVGSFPVGTLLGGWTLWVLVKDDFARRPGS